MSEKTLKLSDGRDVSYTGTVREIVKSCHDLALKGMAVTVSTLKVISLRFLHEVVSPLPQGTWGSGGDFWGISEFVSLITHGRTAPGSQACGRGEVWGSWDGTVSSLAPLIFAARHLEEPDLPAESRRAGAVLPSQRNSTGATP